MSPIVKTHSIQPGFVQPLSSAPILLNIVPQKIEPICNCPQLVDSDNKVKNICKIIFRPGRTYKMTRKVTGKTNKENKPVILELFEESTEQHEASLDKIIVPEAPTENLTLDEVAKIVDMPDVLYLEPKKISGAFTHIQKKPSYLGEQIAAISKNYTLRNQQPYAKFTKNVSDIVKADDVGVFVTKSLAIDPGDQFTFDYQKLEPTDIINMMELKRRGKSCYCIGKRTLPHSAKVLKEKAQESLQEYEREPDNISYSCYELPMSDLKVQTLYLLYSDLHNTADKTIEGLSGVLGSERFHALRTQVGTEFRDLLTEEELAKAEPYLDKLKKTYHKLGVLSSGQESLLSQLVDIPSKARNKPMAYYGLATLLNARADKSGARTCDVELTADCKELYTPRAQKQEEAREALSKEKINENIEFWNEAIKQRKEKYRQEVREEQLKINRQKEYIEPVVKYTEPVKPELTESQKAKVQEVISEEIKKRHLEFAPDKEIKQIREMVEKRVLSQEGKI